MGQSLFLYLFFIITSASIIRELFLLWLLLLFIVVRLLRIHILRPYCPCINAALLRVFRFALLLALWPIKHKADSKHYRESRSLYSHFWCGFRSFWKIMYYIFFLIRDSWLGCWLDVILFFLRFNCLHVKNVERSSTRKIFALGRERWWCCKL